MVDHAAIHQEYGPVVRVGPNELSFTTVKAWEDIYVHRTGHVDPTKDPVWYKGMFSSIFVGQATLC